MRTAAPRRQKRTPEATRPRPISAAIHSGKPVNGRLVPATCDAVPRTPPDELVAGFATVFSAASTPPTGAGLAFCVPLDVLPVALELVFDVFDVFDVVLELVFEVLDVEVFEVELVEVFELVLLVDVFELVLLVEVLEPEVDDEPHVSPVGTTCVDWVCPKTILSACFVKCAECVFVIRCSFRPWSTPRIDCDDVVTMSCPQTCVTETCGVDGTVCVCVAQEAL